MPKGSVSHPIEGCPADRLVGILSDAYMLRRSIYFHFAVRLSRYDRKISRHVNSRMCRVHYVWSSSSHARISSPWTLVFIALVRFAYSPWRRSFAEACIPSPLIPTSCRAFPQTVYKPATNRPTNRARHLRNSYKPYKI